ncbi:XRE family transcriptional regulator [Streptomyces sp. NPDC059874]|uniref:XRE family transcriptional regulator n=1 Tax=Streptomyces sp. NPDC059874 TaxID=3346983 RepID=UPI00365B9433
MYADTRRITVRATDHRPVTCDRCYRGPIDECVVCGRRRHGVRVSQRGWAFHCRSCQPRPSRRCDDCGAIRQVKAIWPLGTLCGTCHQRRKRNPEPCSQCSTTRVLAGRTPDGHGLCGPCAGRPDIDFACRRCGFPGDIYADSNCTRCVVTDQVHDLLSVEDGTIAPQLLPLAEALIAVENAWSILDWLRRENSGAKTLPQLATRQDEITHDVLDSLPQDAVTRYVRAVLVATAVLPRRQEHFAQLELWLDSVLEQLPTHQARIIRPFAEWHVVRDARRRAERGRYTAGSASADRTDVRVAIEFLTWLDDHQLDLATVAQEDLDLWLTAHPTRRRGLSSFIRWTVARRLTAKLSVPPKRNSLPANFLTEDEYDKQLRRCLNDDTLPVEVRIVGALVRLYALPITRILELTTDRFHREEDGAYFTFDRNPVLLPPKLAHLIEQQITRPRHTSMLRRASDAGLLLPGRPPTKPRSASSVTNLMKQHGLPVLAARNTAMLEAVSELPPIVVSDLFGVSASNAHTWAGFAQDSWTDYLAACQEDG